MPMQRTFDKSLELKALGAAVTSTDTGTALAFKAGCVEEATAVVNVTAIDRANADETYVFSLEASSDNFSTVTKKIAEIASLTAIGRYELAFSGPQVEAVCPGATHIRIKCTIGGTTPSITYGAWLAKL